MGPWSDHDRTIINIGLLSDHDRTIIGPWSDHDRTKIWDAEPDLKPDDTNYNSQNADKAVAHNMPRAARQAHYGRSRHCTVYTGKTRKVWLHPQIRQLHGMKNKTVIGLPLNLHCNAIAALFFFSYCRPIWGHWPPRLLHSYDRIWG